MTTLLQRAWHMRSLWLGPCGIVSVFFGLLLLGAKGSRWLGAGLIVLGCVVAGFAWRRVLLHASLLQDPEEGLEGEKLQRRAYLPSFVSFAAAGLASIFASVAFVADSSATFGISGWLWLASIGLLVVGCLIWPRSPNREDVDADRWPGWEKLIFVVLVVAAAVLRLWNLNNFPFFVFGDETETGRIALEAYTRQPTGFVAPSVFSLLWPTIDMPGLWLLVVAKSIGFGGGALWGLRLPAAMFGSAMAIPFYGFVRSGWGRGAAIAGTAMLAFSAVAVHYSRITINNIATPFFWAVCFLFVLRGLQDRRPINWVLAGLAGGLSEYFYYGTRLLPFILVVFFAYLIVTNRSKARIYSGYFGLVVFGYLVGFGPLFARYAENPILYVTRAQGMLSWDHIPGDWADFVKMVNMLGPVVRDNFFGISNMSSQDVYYYAPLLLPIQGALLVVGVVLLAVRWRHPASFLALITLVGVLLTGGTLVVTSAAPEFNHWTPAFPAIFVAMAMPVAVWLGASAALTRRWKVGIRVVVVALVVILGYLNINFYFRDYYANPQVMSLPFLRDVAGFLEVRSAQAHFQQELGLNYMVRFLGNSAYLQNPVVPYLARGQDYGPIPDPTTMLPVRRRPGMGLAFVLLPGAEQYRDLVRGLYPGGSDGEIFSRTGQHLFYTYVLGP